MYVCHIPLYARPHALTPSKVYIHNRAQHLITNLRNTPRDRCVCEVLFDASCMYIYTTERNTSSPIYATHQEIDAFVRCCLMRHVCMSHSALCTPSRPQKHVYTTERNTSSSIYATHQEIDAFVRCCLMRCEVLLLRF